METAKTVGIWIRVSTDMQVKDDSPEHHEQRARYYIDHKGWQVAEVYQLGAFSGKSVMEHPETKRMLSDIRSGRITGLVFSKLARLARNTKELLEFADIFRKAQADLVSLAESIDTSSPAGRLFFTIISAMAEWEREEIASRVAASVPIRARMGKPLGGQAAFGYRWDGKEFRPDESEAPVRRLMYELFMMHQRRKTTATALNDAGYRTRNGSLFTATTVTRLLRDSTAKGERRANYTRSTGENRNWTIKPESEWIVIPCEPIVPQDLWADCNLILDAQEKKRTPVGPKAAYLLSGYVQCECGRKMYVYQNSRNYACKACKTRIAVDDIDEIFQEHLRDYLGGISPVEYAARADRELGEARELLATTQKERNRLAKGITTMLNLRMEGEMSKEQFREHYRPLEERVAQLDGRLPELEADVDVRSMQLRTTDVVIDQARTLHDRWAEMEFEERRAIVETITNSIEVGREDITITLAYAPAISLNAENSSHDRRGSYLRPT